MSFKAIVKGESSVSPSIFTIDIPALLAAAGGAIASEDNEGPWIAMLNWELVKADTTGTADEFDLGMNWDTVGTKSIGQVPRNLSVLGVMESYSVYMSRSAPGDLWTLTGNVGVPGDSLISWRFSALHLEGPDALAF